MDDKVPPKKARQGREGFPVLLVLVISLVLAGIIWIFVEAYGIFLDEGQPVETQESSDIPLDEGGAPRQEEGVTD